MKIENTILLYKKTRRTVIFLTLLILAWLLLFAMGNYQHFLDDNQNMILFVASIIGIVLCIFCFIAIVLSVMVYIGRKKLMIFVHTFLYVVDLLFGIFVIIMTSSINYLSKGIEAF